ncbi:MAG: SpoIIE family protein phosphatase [Candidatus Zixiibacteriota bacterium]
MTSIDTRSLPADWPDASRYRRSIRWEFSLYVSAVIVILMLVTGYVVTRKYVTTVTRGVTEKLLVQARSYSTTAGKLILSANGPDLLMLSNVCKKLAADNKDVYWVGIAGADDHFLAHTDIKQLTQNASLRAGHDRAFAEVLRDNETLERAADTLSVTIPIVEQGIRIGRLALAASSRQIQAARRASIVTVASITLAMLMLGIPVTLLVVHRKLRAVGLITDALRRVDLNNIRFDVMIPTRNEFGYLAETVRVMGGKLNRAQQDLKEKERLDRELEIAHEIQESILPHCVPESDRFQMAVSYRSAKVVGGDYYDFLELDDTHLGLVVADVSGKSLPGMLVMLMTRDIIRSLARPGMPPAALLSAVNRKLHPDLKKGMFVTMFLGVLDTESGDFEFASAGHNPLIVLPVDGDTVELVKTRGFPLGMLPPDQFDARIESRRIALSQDMWLVQYTDGLNEGQDGDKNEFGIDRLLETIGSCRGLTADGLVDHTLKIHGDFVKSAPQYDDITLVAVKWIGGRPSTPPADPERELACQSVPK